MNPLVLTAKLAVENFIQEKKIISPEKLNDYLKTLKGKTLTLQTCYPPGTTWKRTLVFARPA